MPTSTLLHWKACNRKENNIWLLSRIKSICNPCGSFPLQNRIKMEYNWTFEFLETIIINMNDCCYCFPSVCVSFQRDANVFIVTFGNSNMLPSDCELFECASAGRMRSTWHFEVLLRGVWTGRRTCWSGCGRKSGTVCCFFPKTNTHRNPIYMSSVREVKPFGRETVDSEWQCTGCSGRTAVKRCNDSAFKLIEIWKKQKFFFPPLLLLSCQIILSFSARAWHRYGNGPGLTSPQTVLFKQTLHLSFNCLLFGCTNILSPYPQWHPAEAD